MAGTATDKLSKTPDLGYTQSSSSPPEPATTDGPLFRATLAQLENRTGALKANVKRLLKTTSQSLEAKQEWLKADINFIESLREMPSLDPLSTHYLDQAWKELLDQRERLAFSMQSLLISPLQKIYDLDIKTADIKRRQFEDESKEYYAMLSKYLSLKTTSTTLNLSTNIDQTFNNNNNNNNNTSGISNTTNQSNISSTASTTLTNYAKKKEQRKSMELEAKHSAKQRHFDLVRFDYYNYLVDLNGGKKEQEVLFHLLTYQQREYDFYQSVAKNLAKWKPGLDELASLMAQASSEQCLVNKERQEKRRQLESKCMQSDNSECGDGFQQQQGAMTEGRSSMSSSRDPPPTTKGQQQQPPPLPTSPRSQMSFMDAISMTTSSSSASCLSPEGYRSSMDPSAYSSSNARTSSGGGDDDLVDDGDNDTLDQGVARRKEGFLFSPATRSTKSNPATGNIWHKHWSVVSGGQLYEYSNWKKHLETHHEPINLRFATVREARNSDRRFCFEVITPQYSRVYQATSQEDMHSWIQAICNAIENALNGESPSMVNLTLDNSISTSTAPIPIVHSTPSGTMDDDNPISSSNNNNNNKALLDRATNGGSSGGDGNRRKSWKDHGRSLTVALNGLRRKKNNNNVMSATATTPGNGMHHDRDTLSSPPPPPTATTTANRQSIDGWASSTKAIHGNLLSMLRKNTSNCYCADCGVKSPEWCSLNLGVVICIDCGGIHRSLGTHITKVRSLMLDTTSFTADAVAMLKNLGNDTVNSILEAAIQKENKVTAKDSNATKQAFIRDKYDIHRFVQLLPPLNDTDNSNHTMNDAALLVLFDALEKDDIPQALNALILGADPNGQRPIAPSLNTEQIFLPVLDIDGNLVHNRTTSIIIPIQQPQHQHDSNIEPPDLTTTTAMKTARYALHFALQHPRKLEIGKPSTTTNDDDDDEDNDHDQDLETPVVFPMAELLIQNGARLDIVDPATGYDIATLLSIGDILTDQAIAYLNTKNQARGRSPIHRISLSSLPDSSSSSRLPTYSAPM